MGASAQVVVVISSAKAATLTSVASVTANQSDANPANNTVTNVSVAALPIVTLGAGSTLLVSESQQPVDGVIEPGETVTIQLGLLNSGTITATNVVAELQLGGGVQTPQSGLFAGASPLVPQPYGNIVPGANVSYPFSFTAVSSNIGTIKATLLVRYGSGATNTVTFNFQMPNAVTFTNDTAIVIPDKGTASVYPSVIDVSGISGYVKKVTATLNGFSPADKRPS
jgi:hypothetical protein